MPIPPRRITIRRSIPDKTVLVYCASGGRSALAGKSLQDLGYKDVRNLGGFKDWAESGGAVEAA